MSPGAEALSKLNSPRVDTRRAERRALTLASFDDLARELDRIEHAARPDGEGLRVTGNWSAGQILEHIAKAIERSMDGFSAPPASTRPAPRGLTALSDRPVHARAIDAERALRATLLAHPFSPDSPGFALPGEINPALYVWTNDGAARLRVALARIRDGHPMARSSPTIGPLSQEEWAAVHLRHAALHLSFIILGQWR